MIEADAPELLDKSAELRGADNAETIANVRSFVASLDPPATASTDALSTDPAAAAAPATARGALATLRSGSADSLDRILLTVALLRAASIPARVIVGGVDDGDGVIASNEMRLGIEFLHAGRWHALDDLGTSSRTIVFRVFASAEEIVPGAPINNLYQAAGLKMRNLR